MDVIKEIEKKLEEMGHSSLMELVKQNQDVFEISNNLLFRAVALSAQSGQDVFLVSTNNGVIFLTENDYIATLEKEEPLIKEQIGVQHPDFSMNQISEEYDNYVAGVTIKHIDTKQAKEFSDKINADRLAAKASTASTESENK